MIATIGGFDGMHVGHQALIKKAQKIIVIEKGANLTPNGDRCEYTALPCLFYELKDIKNLSALEFIHTLKLQNIKGIVVGEDFKFGKNRSGDIELLKLHFNVETVKEVKIDGIGVHSNIIRDFLRQGNIKKATTFLGHTYKIKGEEIKGQGLGKKELLPTINLKPTKNYLIPKHGVYVTLTNRTPSVTFIGRRSTDNNFSIETHMLTPFSHEKIYEVEFLEFIRENKKFSSLQDLKKAITEDKKKAIDYLGRNFLRI